MGQIKNIKLHIVTDIKVSPPMMKKHPSLIILLMLGAYVHGQKKNSDDDSAYSSIDMSQSLVLEHSFGVDDDFSSRGSIIFKNSRAGYASFSSVTELSDDEVSKLTKLVEENGLYFIRSATRIGGKVNETSYVQTFVKACYLYGSGLQEAITVSIDYSGNVIGLNIVSPRSQCSVDGGNYRNVPTLFNSSVIVQHQVAGAVPDVQPFIDQEMKKKRKDNPEGKDNRSFLAKYWMYILPVFLILMLSAQAEPPAEGGGGE